MQKKVINKLPSGTEKIKYVLQEEKEKELLQMCKPS